jgi:hypothetical protein
LGVHSKVLETRARSLLSEYCQYVLVDRAPSQSVILKYLAKGLAKSDISKLDY